MSKKAIIMQGNEAVAKGALAAGCNFFSGYPITPSTEVAEILAGELPKIGGKFLQMEDEIASACAMVGASLTGAKALTATSGPGFSLMQEAIGFAKLAEAPSVILNVQRMGPSTGMPTSPAQGDIMQARWGSHGDAPAIALYPNSVKEAYELTIRAFNLAEKYRTLVVLLMDEVLGHMREAVVVPDPSEYDVIDRIKPTCDPKDYKHYPNDVEYPYAVASYGEGYRFHVTGLTHDESGFPTNSPAVSEKLSLKLDRKIKDNLDDLIDIETISTDDANLGVYACGIMGRACKEAVKMARAEGMNVGLYRPRTIWPFPDDVLLEEMQKLNGMLVVELNEGQLSHEMERLVGKGNDCKLHKMKKNNGTIMEPSDILAKIKEVYNG